jgi:hypothetical protein
MSNYYESEDLKKFGDIGQHAKNLADDFFQYYGDVTGTDGARPSARRRLLRSPYRTRRSAPTASTPTPRSAWRRAPIRSR